MEERKRGSVKEKRVAVFRGGAERGKGFFFSSSVLKIWFYLAQSWNTFHKLQTYFFGAVLGKIVNRQ